MASTYGGGHPRRIAAATALTAAGLLLWPGLAHAGDVSTTPTSARQGDAVRLEFTVPEERAGTKTKQIEVRLPADAPVAEVYPMSVDGWAPRISSRTLDQPVAGIHSSGVSTVTTAVTWVRVGDVGPGPARLALSMGPLPQAEKLTFEVLQTYADGTVVRWADATGAHRAPVLTLLPAVPGATGHGGHGGHGGPAAGAATGRGAGPTADAGSADGAADAGSADGAADAGSADGAADADEGPGSADAMLAAGLLAGLGGGAAIGWLVSRWRRRDPAEHAALAEVIGDEDDAPEPARADRAPEARPPTVPDPVDTGRGTDAERTTDAEPASVGTPVRTG
ncbi:DUF1775 domain-containing protein [Micromonospora sp. CPCC 205539]|uniref:DUF1775 domain-containing protein n=1 Tax=Micromonospora sp. CPCC 205539 TaxID=3122408 RepID=UPI002FEF2FFF